MFRRFWSMAAKRNYQRELDKILEGLAEADATPRLLLHSCCAPCSSYVLEYLSQYFKITVFYYNPNITDGAEYEKRVEEQRRLIGELPTKHPVDFMEGAWEPERFYDLAHGLEDCPEGGERCRRCIGLRLLEAARVATEGGYDYFTTTLTISPLKNAQVINTLGERLATDDPCAAYLVSDFKKRDGYKRSIELSREYDLYRQNYCGCEYSKRNKTGV